MGGLGEDKGGVGGREVGGGEGWVRNGVMGGLGEEGGVGGRKMEGGERWSLGREVGKG